MLGITVCEKAELDCEGVEKSVSPAMIGLRMDGKSGVERFGAVVTKRHVAVTGLVRVGVSSSTIRRRLILL
jgi:hypothetical protein